MSDPWQWYRLDLNPEPWRVPPLAVGRKNGKVFPMMNRDAQLHAYHQAVKEELEHQAAMVPGEISLRFMFWRVMSEYTTPQARLHRKHQADVTNMQKALEDALQGILFENDRDVRDIHSTIVAQGPNVKPMIMVGVVTWDGRLDRIINNKDYLKKIEIPTVNQQMELPFSPGGDDDLF